MLSFLSEAREASGSETPRVHHAARRRGCRVAARGAGAAAGDATSCTRCDIPSCAPTASMGSGRIDLPRTLHEACASDVHTSSRHINVMRRCIALHRARHRRTSPGATPSIRPPSADWQLPALSSAARSSPGEALGSALGPCSPGAFSASARGLLTPHRLSSEGDTICPPLQSIHGRMELTVLQLASRGSAACTAFLSGACANWLWPAPRLAPPVQYLRCPAAQVHQLLRM